jgi:hypothetical protein
MEGREEMTERRMRLSKDKLRFLETWKEEKHDHLQEIFQHVEDEERQHNHTHFIDPNTYDIFFTGLTLLPLDLAKRVLTECTFFTCYLSDYDPGYFFDKSDLSGYHLIILLFTHGESIPKYWNYLLHEVAHYVLAHFGSETDSETKWQQEVEANKLACEWVEESPYTVPRETFEQCDCPEGTIRFCKALATTA